VTPFAAASLHFLPAAGSCGNRFADFFYFSFNPTGETLSRVAVCVLRYFEENDMNKEIIKAFIAWLETASYEARRPLTDSFR
jgi:hypothetical protein